MIKMVKFIKNKSINFNSKNHIYIFFRELKTI